MRIKGYLQNCRQEKLVMIISDDLRMLQLNIETIPYMSITWQKNRIGKLYLKYIDHRSSHRWYLEMDFFFIMNVFWDNNSFLNHVIDEFDAAHDRKWSFTSCNSKLIPSGRILDIIIMYWALDSEINSPFIKWTSFHLLAQWRDRWSLLHLCSKFYVNITIHKFIQSNFCDIDEYDRYILSRWPIHYFYAFLDIKTIIKSTD